MSQVLLLDWAGQAGWIRSNSHCEFRATFHCCMMHLSWCISFSDHQVFEGEPGLRFESVALSILYRPAHFGRQGTQLRSEEVQMLDFHLLLFWKDYLLLVTF